MSQSEIQPDTKLDLVLERFIDVPPAHVWKAWTEPEHIVKWFTPAPWTTVACRIDLRPGGLFRTVMRSPEGEEFPNEGCLLEVIPNEKLIFTSALGPGFRPADGADAAAAPIKFTAVITMVPEGTGTQYTAIAIHANEQAREAHEQMGFHQGWGAALDQLVALAKSW